MQGVPPWSCPGDTSILLPPSYRQKYVVSLEGWIEAVELLKARFMIIAVLSVVAYLGWR